MKKYLAFLLVLIVTSCAATQEYKHECNKSYSLGETVRAPVGATMLMREDITYVTTKEWVGILNAPDGWRITTLPTNDSFREELIYSGRSGDAITISYREYRAEFARPAFFQELTYDLSKSSEIVFKDFRMRVLDATNSGITLQVVSDVPKTLMPTPVAPATVAPVTPTAPAERRAPLAKNPDVPPGFTY